MAETNYDINYDDKRFANVEADKQTAINEMNNSYNEMITQSDQYYQNQINAAQDYAKTQQDLQTQNTQFTVDTINQQKEQANKDYTKEQSGSYVDWQKQSNQYGANAENKASQGLTNTGYSESSQVSMYNQYQSRITAARESFNKSVLNYDNSIKEAQLANNSKMAEIAYQALQTQLELSLQGFQYKNQLLLDQINAKQELENTYYGRYQDVLGQINTENAMSEQVRQYNENMALEKEQFAEDQRQYNESMALEKEQFTEQKRQFEQDYKLKTQQYNEDIRQFNTQIAYYKEKDAKEYALKIKQLEEEKRQAQIAQSQWEKEYNMKQQQMAQEQSNWEKEYQLSKAKTYSSTSGSSSASINKTTSSSQTLSSGGQELLQVIRNTLGGIQKMPAGMKTQALNYLKQGTATKLISLVNSGKITKNDASIIARTLDINP